MLRLLIIAQESKRLADLCVGLAQNDCAYSITSYNEAVPERIAHQSPDLLLVEMDGYLPNSGIRELCQRTRLERHLPIIALVAGEMLDDIDSRLNVDDFITNPYDTRELVLRIKRLLHRTKSVDGNELIKCEGLVIDLAKCEVTLEGKSVVLTFREYELLKFLASNRGRVFSREALLNNVWKYDYYGGDRTIDVHIRRLRSKIEDPKRGFIETVRNIGYRFREDI